MRFLASIISYLSLGLTIAFAQDLPPGELGSITVTWVPVQTMKYYAHTTFLPDNRRFWSIKDLAPMFDALEKFYPCTILAPRSRRAGAPNGIKCPGYVPKTKLRFVCGKYIDSEDLMIHLRDCQVYRQMDPA